MLAMAAFTFWGAFGVGLWTLGATKLYVMEPAVALGKGLVGTGVAVALGGAVGPLGRIVALAGVVLVATV